MGISVGWGFMDILKEAKYHDVSDKKVLLLGRQIVYMSPLEVCCLAKKYGIEPIFRQGGVKTRPEVHLAGCIDEVDFFKVLGFGEVQSLDISDYEDADINFDLCSDTLPTELVGAYDYIFDGGTLEHVFDTAKALINISRMLKIHGKVMHIIPANNSMTHGLYQFSPNLLPSFYANNGFDVIEAKIVVKEWEPFSELITMQVPKSFSAYMETGLDCRLLDVIKDGVDDFGGKQTYNKCIAEKLKEVENFIPPYDCPEAYSKQMLDMLDIFIGINGLGDCGEGCVAIWGCGKTGRKLMAALHQYEDFNDEVIAGYFDSYVSAGTVLGKEILPTDKMEELGIDTILIASIDFEDEIYEYLRHLETKGIRLVKTKEFFQMGLL